MSVSWGDGEENKRSAEAFINSESIGEEGVWMKRFV